MLASALCVAAFALCLIEGRKALWRGVAAVMVVGYAYGIVRANVPETMAHFIFDAGAVGLYLAMLLRPLKRMQRLRLRPLMPWLICLIAWPMLLFVIPIQDPLVQLVGLRGAIFFLPFILLGAMLENKDWYRLAWVFAGLNLVAFVFALAEAHFGLTLFYPRNAVTQLIYRSRDVRVGEHSLFRIPAVFTQSAAYAGVMVGTVPILVAMLHLQRRKRWPRNVFLGSLAIAAIGVFLAASRTEAIFLIMLVCIATLSGRIRTLPWAGWMAVFGVVALLVATVPRLQRVTTLDNSKYVKTRVEGSVNESFLTLMFEYPMGNGLGGGGTSMPYFLKGRLRNPVQIENEYGLIMLEEGIPGLLLWIAFLIWVITRPAPRKSEQWYIARWLARFLCLAVFVTAVLGTGLLTAIPGTGILLMYCGWLAAPQPMPVAATITRYRGYAYGAAAELHA
ncbi:MAG: O-antigen ligase family protein [Candidatus Binataceae bacterium]